MTDFLASALGYFSSNQENSFVGSIIEVGTVKLRVKQFVVSGKLYLY